MATQFTANAEECLQLHCVERYSEPSLGEINVIQAKVCVNQAIDPECLLCFSQHSPDAAVAHSVHLRVSVCPCVVLSFFLHVTCTDDPHRLKCAIKSQVRSQVIVHPCRRIVEQIVDGPVPQKSGTCCHSVTSQT